MASNVEQLRVQLAEAEAEGQAEAAQAPMTQKVAHSRESVCLLLFFRMCLKRALSYADDFKKAGGVIECRREVTGFDVKHQKQILAEMQIDQTDVDMQVGADTHIVRISCEGEGESYQVCAKHAVVCGGLQADRLAQISGCDSRPKIVPLRRDYLFLDESKRHLVKGNINPVPHASLSWECTSPLALTARCGWGRKQCWL